jgi:hypothetical protein
VTRVFYGPGDWLANRTSARTRRACAAWLLILWLGPGTIAWLMLRDVLWFVGLMSLVALWWTGWSTVGTETPVEKEGGD